MDVAGSNEGVPRETPIELVESCRRFSSASGEYGLFGISAVAFCHFRCSRSARDPERRRAVFEWIQTKGEWANEGLNE